MHHYGHTFIVVSAKVRTSFKEAVLMIHWLSPRIVSWRHPIGIFLLLRTE